MPHKGEGIGTRWSARMGMQIKRRAFLTALAGAGALAGIAACARPKAQSRPVAILRDAFPGAEWSVVNPLVGALRRQGFRGAVVDGNLVSAPSELTADRYAALVLADSRFLPASALGPLWSYLTTPGSTGRPGVLVAVGGPAFEQLLGRSHKGWLPMGQVLLQAVTALHKAPPWSLPFDAWSVRSGGGASQPLLQGQPRNLTLSVRALNGTALVGVEARFGLGETRTVFSARGNAATPRCVVEWEDHHGTLWVATVPLDEVAQGYVLAPSDFQSTASTTQTFDPSTAVRLWLGFDTAYTGPLTGALQLDLADFATTVASASLPVVPEPPRLTGIWPVPAGDADEAFVTSDAVQVELASGQVWVQGLPTLPGLTGVVCPVYRARGWGIAATELPERFVPLAIATGKNGVRRGAPGAAILHWSGPQAGGAQVVIGLPPARLAANAPWAAEFVAQALGAVLGESWLQAAGPGSAVAAGSSGGTLPAVVVQGRGATGGLSVRFQIDGKGVGTAAVQPVIASGSVLEVGTAPGPWSIRPVESMLPALSPGEHTLVVDLVRGTETVDSLAMPLRAYTTPPERRQTQVTQSGGEFWAGSRPWRPVGVNYWPRSTSGLAPDLFTEGWLSPGLYDPDVVEADLMVLGALGFNVVTGIEYEEVDQAPALRDFLARCDAHGIRAMVFVNGGDPFSPDPATLISLLTAADLPQDPALFAYDLCWDPAAGDQADRTANLAGAWAAWIDAQYGSLAAAQAVWGYAGGLDGPTDAQLLQDGPWRVMVAAYRRFIDDTVAAGYAQSWRAIRALGDTHLIGARTGGGARMAVVTGMPLDLASGAAFMDFVTPEGYGLGPSYADAAAGGLIASWGKAVSAGKPVFWIEWGISIWVDPSGLLAEEGELYQSLWELIQRSGSSGGTGWWMPGGWRVDEDSDYGILNADGSARPAAVATAAAAQSMATLPALPQPTRWIVVDRDQYVAGYAGIQEAFGAQYAANLESGQLLGIQLPGQGTTSLNCPLVAVGGGPYSGAGPLQALNAAFASVTVGGVEIPNGGTVSGSGTLVVEMANTAPATWENDVMLVVDLPGGLRQTAELLNAPVPFCGRGKFASVALSALQGEVRLRLQARGAISFGPIGVYTIT